MATTRNTQKLKSVTVYQYLHINQIIRLTNPMLLIWTHMCICCKISSSTKNFSLLSSFCQPFHSKTHRFSEYNADASLWREKGGRYEWTFLSLLERENGVTRTMCSWEFSIAAANHWVCSFGRCLILNGHQVIIFFSFVDTQLIESFFLFLPFLLGRKTRRSKTIITL